MGRGDGRSSGTRRGQRGSGTVGKRQGRRCPGAESPGRRDTEGLGRGADPGSSSGAGVTCRKFQLEGLLAARGPGRGLGTPQTHAAPGDTSPVPSMAQPAPRTLTRLGQHSILDLPFQKERLLTPPDITGYRGRRPAVGGRVNLSRREFPPWWRNTADPEPLGEHPQTTLNPYHHLILSRESFAI